MVFITQEEDQLKAEPQPP